MLHECQGGWFTKDFRWHDKVRFQTKKTILFGNFSQHGGGGLPKPKNFVKFPKFFLYGKIHGGMLKRVTQRGGGDI